VWVGGRVVCIQSMDECVDYHRCVLPIILVIDKQFPPPIFTCPISAPWPILQCPMPNIDTRLHMFLAGVFLVEYRIRVEIGVEDVIQHDLCCWEDFFD